MRVSGAPAQALVLVAALCFLCVAQAQAPKKKKPAPPAADKPAAAVPSTYEVSRGDTLFRIAAKARHPGTTLNQTVLALYRANPEAFLDANINQLVVGRILTIPGREAVIAVDAAQASRDLKALIAKPVVAPAPAPAPAQPAVPPPKEPAAPKPRPERPPKPAAAAPALNPQQATERYLEGVEAERRGALAAALAAYLAAGESGNGLAQKRLGDLYNTGNAVVSRDYETALRWYRKAREQGIEIPKPVTHAPIRPN